MGRSSWGALTVSPSVDRQTQHHDVRTAEGGFQRHILGVAAHLQSVPLHGGAEPVDPGVAAYN